MKIASLPGRGRSNPYVDLFYEALKPFNIELYDELQIDIGWGESHFKEIDAIHLHWVEFIWRNGAGTSRKSIFRRFLRNTIPGGWRFIDAVDKLSEILMPRRLQNYFIKWNGVEYFREFLKLGRSKGVNIIWTLHNLESHEEWDWVDHRGFQMLARFANLVICHSELARSIFIEKYKPSCEVIVMPHGNYVGVFPEPRPRQKVLEELGLDPTVPVAGCIGALRDYKGFDIAFEAIKQLGGRVQLICAGEPNNAFPLAAIEQAAKDLHGVVLISRSLSAQEFSDLSNASDLILLPYRKITGSGALLSALTFGRGVVASDLPYFRDLLSEHPNAGILVKPEDANALAFGVRKMLCVESEVREQAALSVAGQYSWCGVIRMVSEPIRKMQRNTKHGVDCIGI